MLDRPAKETARPMTVLRLVMVSDHPAEGREFTSRELGCTVSYWDVVTLVAATRCPDRDLVLRAHSPLPTYRGLSPTFSAEGGRADWLVTDLPPRIARSLYEADRV